MKSIIVGLLALLCCVLPHQGNACLNEYFTVDQHGEVHSLGLDYFRGFNKNFNHRLIHKKLKKHFVKIEEEQSVLALSDYAVLLLKAGKVNESLIIFQRLQQSYPEEYAFASNLGTAYELKGELDSALHYIQLGMELNPNAHEGSEWVHVRILEVKKQLIDQSNWLEDNEVLSLSDEDKKDPDIRDQLEIQIRERFPFTPNKDGIMASLMTDLADCYAESFSYEFAHAFYKIAEEYYGAPSDEIAPKIQKMLDYRAEHKDVSIPEDMETMEGSNILLGETGYESILDNNNDPPFSIPWDKHIIEPNQLLSMVDLNAPLNHSELQTETSEDNTTSDLESETKEKGKSNRLIYGLIALSLGLGLFFLIRKNRQS